MDTARIARDTLDWFARGGTIAAPPPGTDNGERAEVDTRAPQASHGGGGDAGHAAPGLIAWWCSHCQHDLTSWSSVQHHIGQGHDVTVRKRGRHEMS